MVCGHPKIAGCYADKDKLVYSYERIGTKPSFGCILWEGKSA